MVSHEVSKFMLRTMLMKTFIWLFKLFLSLLFTNWSEYFIWNRNANALQDYVIWLYIPCLSQSRISVNAHQINSWFYACVLKCLQFISLYYLISYVKCLGTLCIRHKTRIVKILLYNKFGHFYIYNLANIIWQDIMIYPCHVQLARGFEGHIVIPTYTLGDIMLMTCFPTAAAAAAKSLQSCPTLCDPIDGSPPGSPVPGILQARTLEWVFQILEKTKRS